MPDMKVVTPDTTLTETAFVLGADSQAASAPSLYPVADFAVGAKIAKAFKFAYDPARSTDSLAYSTSPRLDQVYTYAYWNGNNTSGAGGIARCIAISGDLNAIGTVIRAGGGSQVGMLLTGANGSTYHLIPNGDSLPLASYGVDTSGATSGHKARIESVVAEAFARKTVIRSGGTILVNEALIFGQAFVDLSNTTLQAINGFLESIATVGGPSVSSAVGTPIQQAFQVQGYDPGVGTTFTFDNGTSSFAYTVPKTAIGVTVDNVNTGSARVQARAWRCGYGLVIKANTEKATIEAYLNDCEVGIIESLCENAIVAVTKGSTTVVDTERAHPFVVGDDVVFNGLTGLTSLNGQRHKVASVQTRKRFTVNVDTSAQADYISGGYVREHRASNASPDSNRIIANMQRVFQALRTGGDSTGFYELVVESRRDPGTWIKAAYNAAINIPLPMVEVKSGKNPCIQLRCRGNDGRLGVYVDRDSTSFVNDKVTLDVVANDDFHGTLLMVDRAFDMNGNVYAAEMYDGKAYWQGFTPGVDWALPPDYPCPAVHINEVRGSFDIGIHLPRCANREGIRLGDVTKNLWPIDLQFPPITLIMSGPNAGAGNVLNRKTGTYPTNKTGLVIEKADRCRIPFKELHGNIDLKAGCNDCTIEVQAEWARRDYTVTMEMGATATLFIRGKVSSDRVIGRAWLNSSLRIICESLSDYNNSPAWFDGTNWHIASDISSENVRDIVANFIKQGNNITVTHDDNADTLTITSTGAPAAWDGTLLDAAVPSAPGTGLKVFSRSKVGRSRLATRGAAGQPYALQRYIGSSKTRFWSANGSGTAATVFGMGSSLAGTATARTPASTNDFTLLARVGYIATAAINQPFGLRHGVPQFVRANSAGGPNSGFEYTVRFGMSVVDGNLGTICAGMVSTVTIANGDPANYLSCVFAGKSDGDANLSIYHNDGSGTCTKIDLGANFPANTANIDAYEVRVAALPNSDRYFISVERLFTGHVAEMALTVNIPDATTMLTPIIQGNTGSSTVAMAMDIVTQYVETDY